MEHPSTSPISSMVQPSELSSRSDRIRYALGTAFFGVATGALFATTAQVSSNWLTALLFAAFLGATAGAQQWVEQTSRTTPRHAKRTWTVGFFASVVTALVVALPVLNWSAQTKDNSVLLIGLAAGVVAIPTLIAAVAIARPVR